MIEPSDLGSLAALNALLQEGSVQGAARRLGLSAPAMSHALARLRDRLGDPLLVRAGREMVLTPRAMALRPLAQDALAAAQAVFSELPTFHPSTLRRTFTLSASDYVLLVFGPTFDHLVSAAAPGVDLRFLPNAPDDPERLRSGDSDLAIGIYRDLPPELRSRPLVTERLVCLVRQGHPWEREPWSLQDYALAEHVQVAPRGRPGGYVDDLLAEQGLTRRVVRALPYFHVALEWLARSDRVLTVSERLARQRAPELGLVVLDPPLALAPFVLSLVWHPRFDGDPAHRWLREQWREAARAFDATSALRPAWTAP